MNSAYNHEWLHNLEIIKETRRWLKHGFVTSDQFTAISDQHKSGFYHPNFLIRILLFVATLLALFGVTGLLGLMISDFDESAIWFGCIVYGIVLFLVVDQSFIKNNNHYKTGITEALMYAACGFITGGIAGITDGNPHAIFITCILVFAFAAIRYLDLVTTLCAFASLCGFLFFELYNLGGIFKSIIPFVFITAFIPLYFYFKKLKQKPSLVPWSYNIVLVESLSLVMIYAAGNYFVVRELSVELMELDPKPGEDIPFAFLFYFLTVVIPVLYLYLGIRRKDLVLLRVSLLVFAFSVFTFKYYYGFGHPEISLTVAGGIVILITLYLMQYLKTVRHGYTRENLLEEKWGSSNIQAFVISQTMGGNQPANDDHFESGGGSFGGGGATQAY